MSAYEPKSRAEAQLRSRALALPETHEDFPWGHRALKVKGKAFVFMGWDGERFSLSCKLPQSHVRALDLPFAEATGYGLGKSGWVTASFDAGERIPLDVLAAWVDESYRAIAPKRVLKLLDAASSGAAVAKRSSKSPVKRKRFAAKTARTPGDSKRKRQAREPRPRAR